MNKNDSLQKFKIVLRYVEFYEIDFRQYCTFIGNHSNGLLYIQDFVMVPEGMSDQSDVEDKNKMSLEDR